MFSYLKDTNATQYYTGSAWTNLDTTGMVNPMTTTGDTIYSSSGTTPARLGIGSSGQVLTVAAGIPSWATPASGTPAFVGCSLTKTIDQSIANNTFTLISWDSEVFDTDGFHDNSTNNSRITIPSGKAGKYLITSQINWVANSSGSREISIYKNNANPIYTQYVPTTGECGTPTVVILDLAVGDYVEAKGFQDSGAARSIKDYSVFQCQYLGA
jgi:hypothetical protein